MPRDLPPALRALLDTADAIMRRSSAAHVAIARLDGLLDPEVLPTDLRAAARKRIADSVQRTATPISGKEVAAALKRAWDDHHEEVLDHFDESPAAVRSDAQVHHGAQDGTRLAITVQRPGVAQQLRSDLSLLDLLVAPLGGVLPGLDASRALREVRERALDELDLEHEASAQRQAARALRRAGAGVRVAAPRTDLCSHDVLVVEHVEGPTLAEAAPADPGAAARALIRLAVGAPRALGVVFAELRPDEIVHGDDGLVVRRLGAAREVAAERVDAARDALRALREDDAGAFAQAVGRLGALPDEDAHAVHAIARELAADLLSGPARLDAAVLSERADRALARVGELVAIAQRATPDPADLWPARMVAQLVATLATLEATEDWGALALEALEEGWS
ncbi:MAG TPA: AarF/UbiB family protein [Baekduia sp.]|nr:AarF/UbiB family protein [Baekduia sp.]